MSYEEGEKIARENGLNFIEINSKEYGKVESAFKKVSEGILNKVQDDSIPMTQGIGVKTGDQEKTGALKNNKKKQKNGGCCS